MLKIIISCRLLDTVQIHKINYQSQGFWQDLCLQKASNTKVIALPSGIYFSKTEILALCTARKENRENCNCSITIKKHS